MDTNEIIKTVKKMSRVELETAHMADVAAKWGEAEAEHPSNAKALRKKHTTTLRLDHAIRMGAAAGISPADERTMLNALSRSTRPARFGLHGNS